MTKRINNGTRLHVVVPQQQRVALERCAAKTGISVSEHLRRAIDQYLQAWAARKAP